MKKSRTVKKWVSMILCMIMMLATALTAFAAGETTTITVKNGVAGAEYDAYQILKSSNVGAQYAYTVNEKYEDILKYATGKNTSADIVTQIAAYGDNTPSMREFADAVYLAILEDGLAADKASEMVGNVIQFKDVPQGYYLIAERTVGADPDTYTLVMLGTAGKESVEINTKENVPTFTKKVLEINDSTGARTWQDAADYDLNDLVQFELKATLPDNYSHYRFYTLTFHDELSAGLGFDFREVGMPPVVTYDYEGNREIIDPADYRILTEDTDLTDDCSFEIVFDNLKNLDYGFDNNTNIYVNFMTRLTEDCAFGREGNPNIGYITYTNDAYYDPEKPDPREAAAVERRHTANSAKDKVMVYTYQLDVTKIYDKNGEPIPLTGAGFTLYKWIKATADNAEDSYEPVGTITSTENEPLAKFIFNALDSGQYKLVESQVPAGYYPAEDVEFEIRGTYDANSDDPQLKNLEIFNLAGELLSGNGGTFVAAFGPGIIFTAILNTPGGTILPGTGGIGTAVFYLAGILLMAGALFFFARGRKKGSVS